MNYVEELQAAIRFLRQRVAHQRAELARVSAELAKAEYDLSVYEAAHGAQPPQEQP